MGRQYQALLLLANNFKVFYKDTTGTVHNIIQNITGAYFSGTVACFTHFSKGRCDYNRWYPE